MNGASNGAAPDPGPVLEGLKDFQRRTVDYVFERLYGEEDPVRRFLVADEVGLGKTMVARGLIARAVEELWERLDEIKRIDVLYICSSQEIAGQNIERLQIDPEKKFARPTRITLLPRTVEDLRSRPLNFVSLTPGTSFDPHSSLGVVEERAVLFLLLEKAWEFHGAAPRNVLAGGAARASLDDCLEYLRWADDIDNELAESFAARLREPAGLELRQRWEELLPSFARAGRRTNRPEEARWEQASLIGDLRRLLAETCVEALEPDLIILDEFQRFRDLVHVNPLTGQRSEAGELADTLFQAPDARVLLLSATPYKPYTRAEEEDGDHYRDFLETARFLLDSSPDSVGLEARMEEIRTEMLNLAPGSADRLRELRHRVESILQRVMCRTERLAATPDRDGMLLEAPLPALEPTPADLRAYLDTARVAEALEEPDPMEYWKSAPYLLNLMDDYKLKRELRRELEEADSPAHVETCSALRDAGDSLLPFQALQNYEPIDPRNARLRALTRETVEQCWWQLMWLPPTLPHYSPGGAFAAPELDGMTKRLIFSSWTVVPKAIATLLSHEAERRAAVSSGITSRDSERRHQRSGLLNFKRSDDRLSGMRVLAMLYPSFALAECIDLNRLAAASSPGGQQPSAAQVLASAAEALRPKLAPLVEAAAGPGPIDRDWYWAAPLLLDVAQDRDRAEGWLEDPLCAAKWSGVEELKEDAGWVEHVERAATVVRDSGLGAPPHDLLETLALIAVAGPGVCSLRALSVASGADLRSPRLRFAAGRVAWSLRALLNTPEATDVIRGAGPYWRRALDYCRDGCLQAVLDEYGHLLRETVGDLSAQEVAEKLATRMREAISVRTSTAAVDEIDLQPETPALKSERLRMRFAMRFGDQRGETDDKLERAEHVRHAFNSPFWPFVLASTSVGQEGLDFHPYCHAVVHWNLPSNPVDLEQREGRVHRYKGHAVRRNLVASHGSAVRAAGEADAWTALFDAGVAARPAGSTDIEPYWIAPGEARVERHVLAPLLSRDRGRLRDLRRSLTLYRMVFGQPRQEDLLEYLANRVDGEERELLEEALRIDLRPGGLS